MRSSGYGTPGLDDEVIRKCGEMHRVLFLLDDLLAKDIHGHVKVAVADAKAVIAEMRGVDLWSANERMALFYEFKNCFAHF